MLTINDSLGNKRFETPINKGSKRVFKLMGDDYVTIKFSVKNPVYFELGDYCDIPGFGRFELVEPYQPTYNKNNGGYDYELKLEAQHMKWRNKIMRYLPNFGGSECAWQLTATAEVHLEQVLINVMALVTETRLNGDKVINQGYLYNREKEWQIYIDGTVDASAKLINYDKTNIIDALTAIAESFECEWWLNGNIICLGKCEDAGEYVDLELGKNVADMSRSDSKENYVTRIIAFGSERNISPRYRKDLIFDVKETANSGNRISDTSRPLYEDYFSSSQIVASSGSKSTLTFTGTKTATISAGSASDVLIHTESKTVSGLKAGDWKVDLSKFKPSVKFSNRKGIIDECHTVIDIVCKKSGTSDITAKYDCTNYIPYDGATVNPTFSNQTLSLPTDVDSYTVTVSFYAKFKGSGSVEIDKNVGTGNVIELTGSNPDCKITGLTIEVIDGKGNTIKTLSGAVYNPDFKESLSERNWIQLPSGAYMSTGDRFRIKNIIETKVKSSYFSSRFSAYEDTANVVKSGIVTSRLMLPESNGTPYIDYKEGLSMEQGVEDVVVFEDIYPRAICTVTSVSEVQRKETVENDDGSTTERTFTAYRIKDDFFTSAHPFKNDYIIPNETLKVYFQDGSRYKEGDTIPDGKRIGDLKYPDSGKLNGWSFEVQFTKDSDGSAIWEIVRDNTSYVPNEVIHPEIGDTFVLTGFDIGVVDELYVAEAEAELLEKAKKYLEKLNVDPSTYDCTIMPDVAKAGLPDLSKSGILFEIGKRINLINEAYIPSTVDGDGRKWGRKSRVIGYEINLDIPYDNPIYTIGEKPTYSRFGEIEDQIDALKYSMGTTVNVLGAGGVSSGTSSGSGSGSSANTNGVYVISQTDITPATDYNVFSALRSKLEFASKKASEVINYLWTFAQGLHIGNFVHNNDGAKIDPNGDAEFGDVVIRDGVSVGRNLNVSGDISVDGEITTMTGVTIGSYQPGAYGGRMWVDDMGKVHIETDYIEAREKIQAKEIEIQEETHVGGCQIISPAAMRCSRVLPVYNDANSVIAYKCFFTAEDESGAQIYNQFEVGDLAKCQTFNLVKQSNGKVGNHYYWRKVLECGYVEKGDDDYDADYGREGYILLSNKNGEKDSASDAPLAGDRIVTVGNCDPTKADRANLIILASYGTGSPYIYQYKGITTFALTKDNLKVAISPNGNLFTGKFVIENGSTEVDIMDYIDDNIYLDAYQLVLSNEMAGVPTDNDGNIIGDLPSSKVTVYKGRTVETGWAFALDCVGCKASIVAGNLYLSELAEKNATVTVISTKNDCPTLTKVMTIVKLKEGEMGIGGEHAVEYDIEPDKPLVFADMDGNCDPEQLGCKVYMVIGKQTRVEVPLANTAAITTYAAGDNLLFFNGRLFVDRPVEVSVPTDLILRYVIVNQDYVTDEETGKTSPVITSESEHIYTGPITTSVRMKQIIFKLYRGTVLLDVQTIMVTTDPTAMKIEYNTRFELTDKKIEMEASRISKNEEDIAKLTITAQEIQASVSRQSGIIDDIVNGAGRNLLLKTNQGSTNWGYSTDSMTYPNVLELAAYPERYAPRLGSRSDGTYEIFYYSLRPELIQSGERYTLSFKIKNYISGQPLQFFAMIANTNKSAPLTDTVYFEEQISSTRVYSLAIQLEATANGSVNGSQRLLIGLVDASLKRWQELDFWDLKLEKGSTATAYNAAPEDREDYLYEQACAQIRISADEIMSKVEKKIGESEDRITEQYSSLIEQTAEQIHLEVEAISDELGHFKSEITQTATNISLKVDELAGYENLIVNYSTGIGWAASNNDGEIEPLTSGGPYYLANDTVSAKYLRTPLFNLKANTKYTLSFKCTSLNSSINKQPRYSLKYGDSKTVFFDLNLPFGLTAGTEKIIYKFSTRDTAIENAFIEFAHKGVKEGANVGTSMTISEVILEEGEVAHPFVDDSTGLLATGIDIYNKRIVFTADNIMFQNNNGKESMFIDENGKIYAKFINVDELKVNHLIAGDEDGERVEIKPDEKAMLIYNKDGDLVSSYNGQSHEKGPEGLYDDSTGGTVDMSLQSGSYSMLNGSITVTADSSQTTKKTQHIYSKAWPFNSSNVLESTQSPTSVTFTAGIIRCTAISEGYYESNSGKNVGKTPVTVQESMASHAQASVSLCLEVADDADFTQGLKTYTLASASCYASASQKADTTGTTNGNNGVYHERDVAPPVTTMLNNKTVQATKKGYCRLKLSIVVQASTSGSTATASWGSGVTGGSDLAAEWLNQFYLSNFFANGFCLGIRKDKYVSVYKDATDNMHLLMEESGFGLHVSNLGLQYKHNGGNWLNMPMMVFKGKLTWNSSTEKYTISGTSFDGKNIQTPVRTTPSKNHIHVSLPFPSEWSVLGLSESNTIILLQGVGDDMMKGDVISISSTTLIVEISDDNTANDGNIYVNIFKI